MIGSPEINKVIRRTLSPRLKENGFTKVSTRNNWAKVDGTIWALNITAVGKYFSDVTGWPPMSIHVDLGIYYDFIPINNLDIKRDEEGQLLPKAHQCHLQRGLNSTINQQRYTSRLDNPAEQKRRDLWWIEPDGSNAEEVVKDITQTVLTCGMEWLRMNTEIEKAFAEIKKERNCLEKYHKVKYFAKHLNDDSKFEEYSLLFEQEQKRINSLLN